MSSWEENMVLIQAFEGAHTERLLKSIPLIKGKKPKEGKATAYLCTKGACRYPVQEPSELKKMLSEAGMATD